MTSHVIYFFKKNFSLSLKVTAILWIFHCCWKLCSFALLKFPSPLAKGFNCFSFQFKLILNITFGTNSKEMDWIRLREESKFFFFLSLVQWLVLYIWLTGWRSSNMAEYVHSTCLLQKEDQKYCLTGYHILNVVSKRELWNSAKEWWRTSQGWK